MIEQQTRTDNVDRIEAEKDEVLWSRVAYWIGIMCEIPKY